jgi:hypothetical protein
MRVTDAEHVAYLPAAQELAVTRMHEGETTLDQANGPIT